MRALTLCGCIVLTGVLAALPSRIERATIVTPAMSRGARTSSNEREGRKIYPRVVPFLILSLRLLLLRLCSGRPRFVGFLFLIFHR